MNKKFFAILFAVIIVSGIASAEEAAVKSETALQQGKIGIIFGIPNSTASSISGKYFINDMGALQFDVGFGYQLKDEDDGQLAGGGIKLGPSYVQYLSNTRVAPYFKGGLVLAKNFGDANEGNTDLGLSLAGGLGVEFFVTKEFSIGGEAILGIPVQPTVKIGTATTGLVAAFYF